MQIKIKNYLIENLNRNIFVIILIATLQLGTKLTLGTVTPDSISYMRVIDYFGGGEHGLSGYEFDKRNSRPFVLFLVFVTYKILNVFLSDSFLSDYYWYNFGIESNNYSPANLEFAKSNGLYGLSFVIVNLVFFIGILYQLNKLSHEWKQEKEFFHIMVILFVTSNIVTLFIFARLLDTSGYFFIIWGYNSIVCFYQKEAVTWKDSVLLGLGIAVGILSNFNVGLIAIFFVFKLIKKNNLLSFSKRKISSKFVYHISVMVVFTLIPVTWYLFSGSNPLGLFLTDNSVTGSNYQSEFPFFELPWSFVYGFTQIFNILLPFTLLGYYSLKIENSTHADDIVLLGLSALLIIFTFHPEPRVIFSAYIIVLSLAAYGILEFKETIFKSKTGKTLFLFTVLFLNQFISTISLYNYIGSSEQSIPSFKFIREFAILVLILSYSYISNLNHFERTMKGT